MSLTNIADRNLADETHLFIHKQYYLNQKMPVSILYIHCIFCISIWECALIACAIDWVSMPYVLCKLCMMSNSAMDDRMSHSFHIRFPNTLLNARLNLYMWNMFVMWDYYQYCFQFIAVQGSHTWKRHNYIQNNASMYILMGSISFVSHNIQ